MSGSWRAGRSSTGRPPPASGEASHKTGTFPRQQEPRSIVPRPAIMSGMDPIINLRDLFRERVRDLFPDEDAIRKDLTSAPRPLAPRFVEDARTPTVEELRGLATDYFGPTGVAYFYASHWAKSERHPLLDLTRALSDRLPSRYPVDHPMEGHADARRRFGEPDGTLKIYDLPVPAGGARYREQAETNEAFDAHNDGLGYAGLITLAALFTDSGPRLGGYTYFTNVVRYSEDLARTDEEAYTALFHPEAIRARRPRGKGSIEVTAPVLYLGPDGDPRCFLRVASGEYQIEWPNNSAAAKRARLV